MADTPAATTNKKNGAGATANAATPPPPPPPAANTNKKNGAGATAANTNKKNGAAATANAATPPEDPSLLKFKGLLEALKQVVDGKADCKTLEKPVKNLIQAGEQNVKSAKNKGALKEADLVPLAKEIEKLIPSIQEACKVGANVKKALPVTEDPAPVVGANAKNALPVTEDPAPVVGGGYKHKRKTRKQKKMKRKANSRRRV
jgi:hypothetical protein